MKPITIRDGVAQNTSNRRSAIDGRTTWHEGYAVSQRKRKRVEEVFGWVKTVALQRKTRFRGVERTGWMFTLAAAAYTWFGCGRFNSRPHEDTYVRRPPKTAFGHT